MRAVIEPLLASLEREKLSFSSLFVAVVAVALIRSALEAFSNRTSHGFLALDPLTLFHYAAFYLAMYFALALVVGFFIADYGKASRVLLAGLPLLWLPPLVDLLLAGPFGSQVTYLLHEPGPLLRDLLTFFGPLEPTGVTPGIRIELALAIAGAAYYVWHRTGNGLRALLAGLAVYAVLFASIAVPGLLYMIVGGTGDVLLFLVRAVQGSGVVASALPSTVLPLAGVVALETGFNRIMAVLFVLAAAAFGALLYSRLHPGGLKAHLGNLRPLRLLSYIAFLAAGMGVAGVSLAWPDVLGALALLLALAAAWMAAVCANDAEDVAIDAVSNQERPLIAGTIDAAGMREAGRACTLLALAAAFAASYHAFVFLLVFMACYHLYSASPLRLKRVPVVSSLLIGGAAAATFLAGFAFASDGARAAGYPFLLACGIALCFALMVNVRDLKDMEGDEAAGIATLATVVKKRLGERAAFRILGVLAALGFLASPLFVAVPYLWYAAAVAAGLTYLAIVRVPYSERWFAAVAFLYLLAAGVLYLL